MTANRFIYRDKQAYFDDVVSFLCSLASFSLAAELYVTGSPRPFSALDSIALDSKQVQKRLLFLPHNVFSGIFSLRWPSSVEFLEEAVSIDQNAVLQLGAFEIPLTSFAGSMFIRYFERHKPHIVSMCGENPYEWPGVWNFGRVVRNAIAHGGKIKFDSKSVRAVAWEGLTYSSSDDGRPIVNTDLWPADLIYLMMSMETEMSTMNHQRARKKAALHPN